MFDEDNDDAKKAKKAKKLAAPINIKTLINNIEKANGEGSIRQGHGAIIPVDVFTTGVAAIDIAFGCKGIPQGRIIEIYGHESSGKTTTCLQLVKACQQHVFENKGGRKGVAAFIDVEHAIDPQWASNIGVDIDKWLFSQPDSGEQAFNILDQLVDSGLVDLVVVDSVAALIPQVVLDKGADEHTIGEQAKLMSRGLLKLKGKANVKRCTVVFINQIRMKIGTFSLGNPEETPGGKALKFYAALRVEIKKGMPLKEKDATIAFRSKIKVVKNKIAAPFTVGEYELCVGRPERPIYGIDVNLSLVEAAIDYDIIEKSGGSMINYGDKRLGQGVTAAAKLLGENRDLFNEIREKTYTAAVGSDHAIIDTTDDTDDTASEPESDDEPELNRLE